MEKDMEKEKYMKVLYSVDEYSVKPTKAPFGYYGSKQRIASQIIKELPPHNAWVEAFCGSAAITLAKVPVPIEIINDMDDQIVNLFEQLRNNSSELCRVVALTPYARAEYIKAHTQENGHEPLEKARRFLVATMMSVNGASGRTKSGFSFSQSYTRTGREARVNRWYNLPERLSEVAERLRSVRIENRDARELISMFLNRPATLVYLDPPYFIKRGHKYTIDANEESFHRELLKLCCRARCMILISGYDNELYNSILTTDKGWISSTIETHTRDTTGKDHSRTELLWKNKHFIKAAKTGKVPIRLSAKEKELKKVNPSRKH
jgi:DNA adenine methylase